MKKLTLICLLMSTTVFSQSIGDWKIYSDMKDSKMSLSTDNGFWVVTTGGAYFYNTEDNSFIKLTKAEGLNSQVLTAMCSDNGQKIWFGSQEGYIIFIIHRTAMLIE
jgi:ligand-binding sensor domain-containing protein